jgi:4-hydroxy-tetrahydrodipicolinate reductase
MSADEPESHAGSRRPPGAGAIRVAVAGAAGRMGSTVCDAVASAPGMELVARADPALGAPLADALRASPDVLVDFTVPSSVIANARAAVAAGVHVVIGTSGFDIEELQGLSGANVFVAPNFAIGAVLMMQFAAGAARHMARAEIIELHHDRKIDAPSGTAARTAALMREAVRLERGDADVYEVPIHSVRLPGLVAHQEVILGDVGQTLTIRHDSTDRLSFMPGVLLAIRRVGVLARSPVVGLEHLLADREA